MLTFFRSHWLIIVIGLVYSLLVAGVAYYFVSTAANKSKVASLKMADELKTAKNTLEKSATETAKAKEALNNKNLQVSDLEKTLAAAEQERDTLRSSLETMKQTATKPAAPAGKVKVKVRKAAAPVPTACQEKESAAARDIKEQMQALQGFQADIYRRDSELREKQKQLDEALTKLQAEEKIRSDREKSEYRWPHNGSKGNK